VTYPNWTKLKQGKKMGLLRAKAPRKVETGFDFLIIRLPDPLRFNSYSLNLSHSFQFSSAFVYNR
jgi:hypothetical protein